MTARLGVIGLGEAGGAIAAGVAEQGHTVNAYDSRFAEPALRRFADERGITLVDSPAKLAAGADVLISLTSASVAHEVAAQFAPELSSAHVYSDWNSASPRAKQEIAELLAPSGAGFVDGAVMSAVPPRRHQVPVLLSGGAAATFASAAAAWDMRVEVVGEEPGQAAAVKMYRSLLVKGLEALLLECAVGSARHGVTERVLTSMDGSLPMEHWETLASYLLGRTALHGRRRAEELRQVASTLRDSGVEPLIADAGARRLQWAVDNGIGDGVGNGVSDTAPETYHDVLAALGVREEDSR